MVCSQRDRRHLKWMIWKGLVSLKRQKKQLFGTIMLPILFVLILLVLRTTQPAKPIPGSSHIDNTYVTSSKPNSVFPQSNIQSYQALYTCSGVSQIPLGAVGNQAELDYLNSMLNAMIKAQQSSSIYKKDFIIMNFTSTQQLEDFVSGSDYSMDNELCFALELSQFDIINQQYNFVFRAPSNSMQSTNQDAYSMSNSVPNWSGYSSSKNSQFLAVMTFITNYLLQQELKEGKDFNVAYIPMYTMPYKSDTMGEAIGLMLPIIFLVAFMMPLIIVTYQLAEEKEHKLKAIMKMMGLRESTYTLSWFLLFFILTTILSIISTIIVSINILPYSNKFLIFIFIELYGISQFGVIIIAVTICTKVRSATLFVSIFQILCYFLVIIMQAVSANPTVYMLLSLLPSTAMNVGFRSIWHLEQEGAGLTFGTINNEYLNSSFLISLIFIIADSIIYTLLGLYIQKVGKSDYGQKEKWYFCLTGEFWTRNRRRRERLRRINEEYQEINQRLIQNENDILLPEEEQQVAAGNTEKPMLGDLTQEDLKNTLRIQGLRKVFDDKKIAVDNISISMFKGQIFALLGHNGAGKTTTIQMLTGLIPHTAGTATALGINVFNELDVLQEFLGVCPQHDILFENLTVEEHLKLFGNFKNASNTQIATEMDQLLEDLSLMNKKKALAKTLSGGQKRKLSLAIALIGDSKLVLLDEPTSGLDPTARRGVWDMLKKYKDNRIIILTTHYMDEADVLGDRIAIMSQGKIKCCGSSLFLKNKFGVGYLLEVQKKQPDTDLSHLQKVLHNHINEEEIKNYDDENGNKVFQLPQSSSVSFPQLFEQIDSQLEELNISSYSLRVTTLEEVFIKIGEESETTEHQQTANLRQQSVEHRVNVEENSRPIQLHNKVSFMSQFGQLFKRRRTLQCREKSLLVLEVIFPIVYLGLGFFISSLKILSNSQSLLITDPSLYPVPNPLLINSNTLKSGNPTPLSFFQQDPTFNQAPLFNIVTKPFTFTDSFIDNAQLFDETFNKGTQVQFGNYFMYDIDQNSINAVVFANLTSPFSLPVYGSLMLQSILRYFSGNSKMQLQFTDYPLPITLFENAAIDSGRGVILSVFIAFAFQMIAAAIVSTITKEKQTKIKQQLFMSGASINAYFLANFAVDVILHLIIEGATIIYIHVFGLDIPQVWVLCLLFALANPAFIYFWSLLFEKEGAASSSIRIIFILFGCILPMACSILQLFDSTETFAIVLSYFMQFTPIFSLTFGLLKIAYKDILALKSSTGVLEPLQFECAGASLMFLVLQIFVYGTLTLLIEKGIILRRNGNPQKERRFIEQTQDTKDEDVQEEEDRVANSINAGNENIQVHNLKKTYLTENKQEDQNGKQEEEKQKITKKEITKKKEQKYYNAVKDVSFGVNKGECFVLLGINGAGKTSTFKCLVAEIPQTEGQLKLNGVNIEQYQRNLDRLKDIIGYCPQYDPLTECLTVEEHLKIVGILKGLKEEDLVQEINSVMHQFGIETYAQVQSQKLSGGNKRKLCAAMALIGNPLIVFLDEASAGVDPASRRKMWKVTKKLSKESAMIVTTHSMEEAEALASKVGIMVDGKFKCFGTVQHLKNKFGKGYEIEFKIDVESIGQNSSSINQNSQSYFNGETKTSDINKVKDYLKKWSEEGEYFNLLEEFTEKGQFKDFYNKLQENEAIDLVRFMKFSFMQKEVLKIVLQIEKDFSEVMMLDQSQNYIHLRVSKDNKSIGFMFGYVEELKKNFLIREYSVSQTTLEQIFNTFAKEHEIQTLNKRRTTVKIVPRQNPKENLFDE